MSRPPSATDSAAPHCPPLEEHLLETGNQRFAVRNALQRRLLNHLPRAIARPAGHAVWGGGWKHLRHADPEIRFARNSSGLTAITFRGLELKPLVSVHDIIEKITRPVTLVTLGPSARDYDWETLRKSGRLIVAVSGGATFLKERGITPDLLIVSDPDFSKAAGYHVENAPDVPLVIEWRALAALHQHFPAALIGRRIAAIERVNKWFGTRALSGADLRHLNTLSGTPFTFSDVPDDLGRIGWSDRMEWGFFPSATVAFVALQIIVALGGTDIEIVGMDLGGGKSVYADAGTSRLAEQYAAVILPSFQTMRIALAGRGISIRNLSPTCPLPPEVFSFP